MLKRYAKVLAAVALACCGQTALAQQPALLSASCAPCQTACDATCGGGGVYGSVGVLFLKSCSETNPAFSRLDTTVADGIPVRNNTTVGQFENGVDIAWRAELGWSNGNGLGIRGRYFHYRSADEIATIDAVSDGIFTGDGLKSVISTASPLGFFFASVGTADDPSQLIFNNRIIIQTWDLEATVTDRCGCLDLTWSAGVRFLHVAQEYNAFEAITLPPTDTFPPASPINQSLQSGHNLNGAGPLIGIEGRREIMDNFRLYGLGRAGLIFCEGHQEAHYSANFNPIFQIPPIVTSTRADRNRIVTTAEVEFGAEYSFEISRFSELYLRGGLVGQAYFGVGNSSRSNVGSDPLEPKNDNLTLFGLHLTVGVRY